MKLVLLVSDCQSANSHFDSKIDWVSHDGIFPLKKFFSGSGTFTQDVHVPPATDHASGKDHPTSLPEVKTPAVCHMCTRGPRHLGLPLQQPRILDSC